MMKSPNAFQKFLHLIGMQRPVSAFFATRLHYIDRAILKITKGKYTFSHILGWPVIQITTVGAKTGHMHTLILNGFADGEKIALIASSFGRRRHPDWYHNLKKNPECDVKINTRSRKYVARETSGEEREKYWQLAVSYYAGYEKYRERAAHRRIPVMLLEPVK